MVWEGPEDRSLKNQLCRGGLNLLAPGEAGEARYRLVVEAGRDVHRILLKEQQTGNLLWVEPLEVGKSDEVAPWDLVLAKKILKALFMVRG